MRSVRAAFFAFGFFWGTWAVAAFDVQRFLELSDGQLGLMLAATGFVVPDLAWLYFALVQFPIYLLPHLLKPLARRISAKR